MLGTGLKSLVDSQVKILAREVAGKSLSESEILGIWSTIAWGEETAIASNPVPQSNSGCPWVYTKGEKQGQICGGKLKKDSAYCGVHTKGVPPKKTLPLPRTSSEFEGKILLHKHKTLNKLYHPETGMVFESAENKVVIGKIDSKTDKFSELSPEDTEICEKWRFAIKPKSRVVLTTKKVVEEDSDQEVEIDEGDGDISVVSKALWGV